MMNDEQVLAAFKECGALLKGHFKLTSGLHSDAYIQCARVLEHPRLTHELARETVAHLGPGISVDVVASPAVGGILFGFAIASALDTSFIFSERVDRSMVFRRSFSLEKGTRVLVAEDVVTTGGSVKELIALIKGYEAEPVAVVSMVDRGKNPDFGCPYHPLITIDTPSWQPEECRLCQSGDSITVLGSRELANSRTKP